MESNNFDKLIIQARQLDTGIESLDNLWSNPEICIGKFTERSAETEIHIEALWNSMRTVKEGIKTTVLEVDKHIENSSVEHVLQETRREYESLKEQCDNIELILERYGYQYDKDQTDHANGTKLSEQETSQEASEIVEVEFTPNLSWKYKTTYKEEPTSASNINDTSHLSPIPLAKISTSVLEENSVSHINYLSTPIRERPEEPIYSKHFYNSLKK